MTSAGTEGGGERVRQREQCGHLAAAKFLGLSSDGLKPTVAEGEPTGGNSWVTHETVKALDISPGNLAAV